MRPTSSGSRGASVKSACVGTCSKPHTEHTAPNQGETGNKLNSQPWLSSSAACHPSGTQLALACSSNSAGWERGKAHVQAQNLGQLLRVCAKGVRGHIWNQITESKKQTKGIP